MSGDALRRVRQRLRRKGRPPQPTPRMEALGERRGRWRFFLIELVIVFLGVFGAALADDWRQRRQENEQTRLLVANVVRTLDGLIRHDQRVRAAFQREVEKFDAAIARGERPPFVFMFRRGARAVPTVGWDMLLSAGGASRLPPERMYDLGMYFATVEGLSAQNLNYIDFVEREVLPHKDEAGHFYEPGSNRLKPVYRENLDRLRDILALEATLARRAVRLRRELAGLAGGGRLASTKAAA